MPSHKDPKNFYRNGEACHVIQGYACQIVADEAISWLERKKAASRPFFLYISNEREISVRYLFCKATFGPLRGKRYRTLIYRTILSYNEPHERIASPPELVAKHAKLKKMLLNIVPI